MKRTLSESIMTNLNEGESYKYIDGANFEKYGYGEVYNSEANTDVHFILEELKRYFNEGSEFISKVMSTGEGMQYQYPSGEAELLKKLANKVSEIEKELDEWYTNKY